MKRLTPREIAQRYTVSERTIQRQIKAGKIAGAVRIGAQYRVSEEALREYEATWALVPPPTGGPGGFLDNGDNGDSGRALVT